jgi:hypothetical protein
MGLHFSQHGNSPFFGLPPEHNNHFTDMAIILAKPQFIKQGSIASIITIITVE